MNLYKKFSIILPLLSLASCIPLAENVVPANPPIEEEKALSIAIKHKAIRCTGKSSPSNPDPFITYKSSTNQISDDFCVGTRVMYGAPRDVIVEGESRPYVYGNIGVIESYDLSLNKKSFISIKFDDQVLYKEKELYAKNEIGRAYHCVWRYDRKFKACQGDQVVFNYDKSIYNKSSNLPNVLKDLEEKMIEQNDESGQIMEIFSNGYASVYNHRTKENVVFPLNKLRGKLSEENYDFDCDQNPYDGNCQLGFDN